MFTMAYFCDNQSSKLTHTLILWCINGPGSRNPGMVAGVVIACLNQLQSPLNVSMQKWCRILKHSRQRSRMCLTILTWNMFCRWTFFFVLSSERASYTALYRVFQWKCTLLSSLLRFVIRECFIMFCLVEVHPIGHIFMICPLEGHTRG